MANTVLITGASRGIGAACARAFARAGWQVAGGYLRSREQMDALVRELGGALFPIRADVSDPEQVSAMVRQAEETFGHLDALVCNAGIALPGMLLQDVSDEDWARVTSVDLSGVFYCCRSALPHFLHRHQGAIVTVSSMWGQVGGSCEAAYSAAKGGVIALTRALAKEVAPSGIRVNCVAPGVIDTDMLAPYGPEVRTALQEEIPLDRLGTPEDVARAVRFLCSEEASFITGQVLGVNGGMII